MSAPPEALQRKIAELEGWTEVCIGTVKAKGLVGNPPKGHPEYDFYGKSYVPNWPGDRNASRELIQSLKLQGEDYPAFRSAYDEALDYIFHKGYRWGECEECGGDGKVPSDLIPDQPRLCPTCNGAKGEWVTT